jgi:N-acetylmuramoyl-L-alanine amidase CwlD
MYESDRRREQRRRQKAARRRKKLLLTSGAFLIFCGLVVGVVVKMRSAFSEATVEKETVGAPEVLAATESNRLPVYQESVGKKETAPCIVIDAGHGGEDSPGAVFGGICEREINLEIAGMVRDILEEKGYRVIMTQTENAYVALDERVEIANQANAAVFVSIHQNSLDHDTVTQGIETWYDEGKCDGSARLAEIVQASTARSAQAKDRGTKTADDLVVIRDTQMPSCLVETGFLSSQAERRLLTDPAYQEKLAKGIAEGILTFLEETDRI